ncbi:hypothetical protein PHMEG_00021483 [Phytophthora megakarya]|uniref:Uncharacterized protein n=1 Tax=Phytophthora megakarya TaxID=4795 RepID=A0A225VLR4_9STRA|nr:hypothetical protein PHMEG_00021483 [Phytophthora megakarya]
MEQRIPLPENLPCRLLLRTNSLSVLVTNNVPPSPTFVFQVADGYRVLRVKVEKVFDSHLRGQWRDDFVIYFKSTNNASQKDFQVLATNTNLMRMQLDKAWHKSRLREGGQSSFVLELNVYVPKLTDPSTTLRRATAARILEQAPSVADVLREQGITAGPATQNYKSDIQARLPHGTPITVPHNTTFRQLQQVDAQQAGMEGTMQALQLQATAEYQLIRIKIQDIPVAMQVNIGDLRAALKLPSYSLRPPFRPPPSTTTPAPVDDIVDADRIDG